MGPESETGCQKKLPSVLRDAELVAIHGSASRLCPSVILSWFVFSCLCGGVLNTANLVCLCHWIMATHPSLYCRCHPPLTPPPIPLDLPPPPPIPPSTIPPPAMHDGGRPTKTRQYQNLKQGRLQAKIINIYNLCC